MNLLILCTMLSLGAGKEAAEEGALKTMMETFNKHFDAHDAKHLAEMCMMEGSAMDPMGHYAKGRAEVEKLLQSSFDGALKSAHTTLSVDHIQMVKPDVAYMDCTHTATGMMTPDGNTMPESKVHVGVVAVREKGKWMMASIRPHMMMPPPAQGPAAQAPAPARAPTASDTTP